MTPSAILLDLDGTLYTQAGPIPGAAKTLDVLRHRGVPFRCVTNTTRLSRDDVVRRMRAFGLQLEEDDVVTPALATAQFLSQHDVTRVAPFVDPAVYDDLGRFEFVGALAARPPDSTPDAVVVGDLGPRWTPALVNEAFRYVMDGARLVALQKGRYWLGPKGMEVDAGAWVAALEYATTREATVVGKPRAEFFQAALASMGVPHPAPDGAKAVMVGDDLWNDVWGGQQAGLEGWLVKTGKYREDVVARSDVVPDRIVDDVSHVLEVI